MGWEPARRQGTIDLVSGTFVPSYRVHETRTAQ